MASCSYGDGKSRKTCNVTTTSSNQLNFTVARNTTCSHQLNYTVARGTNVTSSTTCPYACCGPWHEVTFPTTLMHIGAHWGTLHNAHCTMQHSLPRVNVHTVARGTRQPLYPCPCVRGTRSYREKFKKRVKDNEMAYQVTRFLSQGEAVKGVTPKNIITE